MPVLRPVSLALALLVAVPLAACAPTGGARPAPGGVASTAATSPGRASTARAGTDRVRRQVDASEPASSLASPSPSGSSAPPAATAPAPAAPAAAAPAAVGPAPARPASAPPLRASTSAPRPAGPSRGAPAPEGTVGLDHSTLPRFSMDLYRSGDFVRQYTNEWCVGASIQMTLNMLRPRNDRSRALQQRLWELARDRSSSPFGGANPRGWVAALNEVGVGPYTLVSVPTFDEALRVAARALRTTRRPVGLVMWRGRHAWVMSGFASRGDPARHRSFRVTGVDVLDPLYPNGSRAWGPSPRPGSRISPATLAKQFVIRDRGRQDLGVPPGFLLVLPTP